MYASNGSIGKSSQDASVLKKLHKSSIFLYNLIDWWLHTDLSELLRSHPDRSDKSFFSLHKRLARSHIFDEIEVYIFVYRRMSCLMSRCKWKRNRFDKLADAEHLWLKTCLLCYLTKCSISWILSLERVSLGYRVDNFASRIFPLEQEHFYHTPMSAVHDASGTLLK